ncbi:MAG: putative nucleoside-diphosphate-sugar epimerase [Rickettsiales bacterium]|jgi:mitochondrial fission protein ELM1|nr:putative nucleoside-diphosphate-sugar epimerase [Rickettsiales bacterium]
MSNPIIWALCDDRAGNVSQVLGIAEALGFPFITKKIRYDQWVKLPNLFRSKTLLGMDKNNSDPLTSPWPDLVILAGRRSTPIAHYIKAQSGGKTKIIQLMWPGFPASGIDLIVIPEHDDIPASHNIIITVGAPHRVTATTLQEAHAQWKDRFPDLPEKKIALLIGGNVGGRIFSPAHAKELAEIASACANEYNAALLITTSRRTSEEAIAALKSALTVPYHLHHWQSTDENPYFGLLALSESIIVTGDSMSMCSEAAATGKPVFIYAPSDLIPEKHTRLHQTLYDYGAARPLQSPYTSWNYDPLQESQKVAAALRKQFSLMP